VSKDKRPITETAQHKVQITMDSKQDIHETTQNKQKYLNNRDTLIILN